MASVRPSSAQRARPRRAWFLGLVLTSFAPGAVAQELDFDIPAQPLATALEQYGNVTGRSALYKSSLMVGRHSTAVRGRVSLDNALTTLLEGTGVAASHMTPGSFLLLPAPAGAKAAAVAQPAVARYYGRIQGSLQRAFCSAGEARPGSYRIGMRLWIDQAGNVTQFERLGSAGSSDIDAGIDRTLRYLQIGAPPPPGLGQPVSIVIRPQAPGVTMSCAESVLQRAGVAP